MALKIGAKSEGKLTQTFKNDTNLTHKFPFTGGKIAISF